MSIVKLKNKKSGTVYVYESESYWDREKRQPRNKRKLIGKLDEEGNIVPTGRSGPGKKEPAPGEQNDMEKEILELKKKLELAERIIRERDIRISRLEEQKKETADTLRKLLEKLA